MSTVCEKPDAKKIPHIILQPEFIRLPRPGESDTMTGLSRSSLLELIFGNKRRGTKPLVESVHVKKPGNMRGIRLIKYASLSKYLNAHKAAAKANVPKPNQRGFKGGSGK